MKVYICIWKEQQPRQPKPAASMAGSVPPGDDEYLSRDQRREHGVVPKKARLLAQERLDELQARGRRHRRALQPRALMQYAHTHTQHTRRVQQHTEHTHAIASKGK